MGGDPVDIGVKRSLGESPFDKVWCRWCGHPLGIHPDDNNKRLKCPICGTENAFFVGPAVTE